MSSNPTSQAKTSKSTKGFKIPHSQRAAGLSKISDAIKQLGLDTDGPKVIIRGSRKVDGVISVGQSTDIANEATIKGYENKWAQFLDFCIAMGDYETGMLFARDLCPLNPWSANPETAIHFLRLRVLPKGEILTHYKTSAPVKYLDGTHAICQGDWRVESTLEKFQASLVKIHSHYDTTRDPIFRDMCQGCRDLGIDSAQNNKSCPKHAGRGSFYNRTGRVSNQDDFKNEYAKMVKYLTDLNLVRATYALLPCQLRDIQSYLISKNDKYSLMIWTIIIVGVKAFLRINEDLDIEIERFEEGFFVCDADSIDALAMWVKGKSDPQKVTLLLWDDKVCPEFSAMRAVLLWIKVSGIKGGKLFPTKEALLSGAENSTTSIDYDTVLKEIQSLVYNVLRVEDYELKAKHIVGTHTLRKTSHLFAYWALMDALGKHDKSELNSLLLADISHCARHSLKGRHVSTYLQDAGSLHQLTRRKQARGEPRHMVGPFVNIRIQNTHQFDYINSDSHNYRKPICDMASTYVNKYLKVTDIDLVRTSIPLLHSRSTEYVPSESTSSPDLEVALRACLPVATANRFMAQIADLVRVKIQTEISRLVETQSLAWAASTAAATPPNKRQKTNEPPPIASPSPAPTRGGAPITGPPILLPPLPRIAPPTDLLTDDPSQLVCSRDYQVEAHHKRIPKATKVQLLEIASSAILEISTLKAQGFVLRDPLKSWANKASKVTSCLMVCHFGCHAAFLAANPKFTFHTFSTCSKGVKHKTHIP